MTNWGSSVLLSDDLDFEADTVPTATATNLDAWEAKNFGAMAAMLSSLVARYSVGKTDWDVLAGTIAAIHPLRARGPANS